MKDKKHSRASIRGYVLGSNKGTGRFNFNTNSSSKPSVNLPESSMGRGVTVSVGPRTRPQTISALMAVVVRPGPRYVGSIPCLMEQIVI